MYFIYLCLSLPLVDMKHNYCDCSPQEKLSISLISFEGNTFYFIHNIYVGKYIVKKATWAILVPDMAIPVDSVPVFCSGVTEGVPPTLSGVIYILYILF